MCSVAVCEGEAAGFADDLADRPGADGLSGLDVEKMVADHIDQAGENALIRQNFTPPEENSGFTYQSPFCCNTVLKPSMRL